ncbi:Eco57I restriction-modification methylase domain-containing protein [Paenibacillus sp. EKM202P]|uniref:Eco57I restriction-modification methylase domain-containing protein n=1 Tax=unclassified Paenibacillus TaxID=185978 RepID=UPI0013ECE9BD|nr:MULTISPECIES: Eco57I restriction-modification methylase domain-containing protein [unclassified Paenibacillus]KAF6558337.1 Eco57I restriction-modification methylase domain-containing protein [Paenibacillus sp. EKM202P]KAF6563271.1 Eco57I restriction-modification methylase domain-containing protein [Paenibacillus sp. EKM207P]
MGLLIQGGEMVFNAEAIHPIDFSKLITNIMTSTRTRIKDNNKEAFEQFFTDVPTALFMAGLFKTRRKKNIRILDAGAGMGVLGAAVVQEICSWKQPPTEIELIAYEIDIELIPSLQETYSVCHELCSECGIRFSSQIIQENFIHQSVSLLPLVKKSDQFDLAILNPPYKKVSNDSLENKLLLSMGIDVSNYYAAFVSLVLRWLVPKGEFVAITPRSFCNGQYFKNFRKDLINNTVINHFHLFESRSKVFTGEDVLQESVIYHAIRQRPRPNSLVTLTFSENHNISEIQTNQVTFNELVLPDDPLSIFRIVKDNDDNEIKTRMESLPSKLTDLKISLSTGPIVDFREPKDTLFKEHTYDTVPLIYPEHFSQGQGYVRWPRLNVKKYNALLPTEKNASRLRPDGNYVVVKRMTSKEEPRRVVAALYEKRNTLVAFENKINFYHNNGAGLDLIFAKGLSIYLNSTLVDRYFRQFSGNTQVNATDLRMIRYPSYIQLCRLGSTYDGQLPNQQVIDQLVDEICFHTNE